jgi:hypothetical protein
MRRSQDVIDQYDDNSKAGRKKAKIIEWFQQHPGNRFDVAEVYQALGEELSIGEDQIRNYLIKLESEEVLQTHGNTRTAYQLQEDIIVPAKYQIRAVAKHLLAIFDTGRWGYSGVFAVSTVLWGVMTFPFWFIGVSLFFLPGDNIGNITHYDFLTIAIAMSFWLIFFSGVTAVLFHLKHKF